MNFFLKNKSKDDGYTLVELLVVIAIVGILSSVVFFAVSSAREKSRMSTAKMYEANHVGALRNHLVAEWKFDDASNRYLDSSGNEHSGSCSGSSCPVVALGEGFNGKDAMRFDGVNDAIYLGVGSDYFPLKTFTTCAWANSSELGSGMTHSGIFSMTFGLSIFMDASGNFGSYLDDNGVNPFSVYSSSYIRDGKYHFICLNFDLLKRNMYVDGTLKNSSSSAWLGVSRWPTYPTVIGTEINNSTISMFKGLIDDVRVYSSVLTASEIQRLYAEESAQRKLADAN